MRPRNRVFVTSKPEAVVPKLCALLIGETECCPFLLSAFLGDSEDLEGMRRNFLIVFQIFFFSEGRPCLEACVRNPPSNPTRAYQQQCSKEMDLGLLDGNPMCRSKLHQGYCPTLRPETSKTVEWPYVGVIGFGRPLMRLCLAMGLTQLGLSAGWRVAESRSWTRLDGSKGSRSQALHPWSSDAPASMHQLYLLPAHRGLVAFRVSVQKTRWVWLGLAGVQRSLTCLLVMLGGSQLELMGFHPVFR